MNQLRAIVIDDSIVYRSQLVDAFSTLQDVRVVGFASDGKAGLEKVAQIKPDLVTLDIEMPVLNGIETLTILKRDFPSIKVIMVSSLTKEGSRETIKALELGALDFITKPDLSTVEQNKAVLHDQLARIISNLVASIKEPSRPVVTQPAVPIINKVKAIPAIIGIGSSTGGPKALSILLPQLPRDLPVPIVITQHMPPLFTASLAESLNRKGPLTVVEARNGDQLKKGTVYIAPGGHQMGIQLSSDGMTKEIILTDDPPENFCKPSVDYLFRAIAKIYKERAAGIILTGMGKDGAAGLYMMKKFGAGTIAQNEQTCTVFGMPKEAILTGAVDFVLPIDKIANEIASIFVQKQPTT
jgi:two-component system chemotaxis response regulator CheB